MTQPAETNTTTQTTTLYSLALHWAEGELTEKQDWETLEPLLEQAQHTFGYERMRNHARGITAERLEAAYRRIAPMLSVTVDDQQMGRGPHETITQWMQRLEAEGPEAVSDFVDRVSRSTATALLPGDNEARYALIHALVAEPQAHTMTLAQLLEAGYDEAPA